MRDISEHTSIKRMTLAQLARRFYHKKSAGLSVCRKDLEYELRENGYRLDEFKRELEKLHIQ